MAQKFFSSKFRVYYEDTDIGGIVYHSNYLKFCERARTDFVREVLHFSQAQALSEAKQSFVVRDLSCQFVAPAHFEEELTVTCAPVNVRRASLQMKQEIYNEQGKLLFKQLTTIAFVNLANARPMALPTPFVEAMQDYIVQEQA